MGTISQLRQSMSAVFSPESERLRQAQKETSEASPAGFHLNKSARNVNTLNKSDKSQDSLGNPATPGYDNIWQRKASTETASNKDTKDGQNEIVVPGSEGKKVIRLQAGWEQILFVQKKICEKAQNLLIFLESPAKYSAARRAKLRKTQGCIVDLDIEKHRKETENQQTEQEKEDAA